MELVPLGVTAEVVVVVEDEDPRLRALQLAVEVRRRESAYPATDDDQVPYTAKQLRAMADEMQRFLLEYRFGM